MYLVVSMNSASQNSVSKDKSSEKPVSESTDSTKPVSEEVDPSQGPLLKVHFLDVGQADAIFLSLPNGQTMLIDAGNRDDGDYVENYLKKQGIKKLDVVIATHPHEDHIGGMAQILNTFAVGKVIMPKAVHNTKTFTNLLQVIKLNNISLVRAVAGKTLIDEKDLNVKILAPIDDQYKDLNNYSVVIKVTYGKTSFLFQGDAESLAEQEIIASGADLNADVLKVGHHGSNSSSINAYLSKVKPKYAIISVGKGNDYGHPNQKTLARLKNSGVKIYRTDLLGTLDFVSDGKTVIYEDTKIVKE